MIHAASAARAALACFVAAIVASSANAQPAEGGGTFLGYAAPAGFIPPFLDPTGVELETVTLADGVYALVSGQPGVDNTGFVVGDDGVLVIDAHINAAMAGQIQAAVASVTDKPILYLVNTNYHGDHTFGNYAFPASTRIIAHRETARLMRDFDREKVLMLATVRGNGAVYEAATLRLPDIVFDDYMAVDLGGRTVEIHHFGAGNTPGDAVVYAPDARVAWTGNLVVGEGSLPPIFEGNAGDYLATIASFRRALDVATIVPGHGRMTTGATLGRYLGYLGALVGDMADAAASGASLAETLDAHPIERYVPLPEQMPERLKLFLTGLHRLNVQQSFLRLTGELHPES